MNKLPVNMQEGIPLSPYTNWKIGGKASYFVIARATDEILTSLDFAKERRLPVAILGGGSNVLVSDDGFPGVVLKIDLQELVCEGTRITAGAGVPMGRVATYSMQQNLAGLEWAVGIPGTLGGAVFGNSNCFGGATGRHLIAAEILDPQARATPLIRSVDREYFKFSYDYSILQETKEILIRATFDLQAKNPEEMRGIRESIAKVAAERAARQPLGKACAGSTFKALIPTDEVIAKLQTRLPNWREGLRDGYISAGFIIDRGLGLKGYSSGTNNTKKVLPISPTD